MNYSSLSHSFRTTWAEVKDLLVERDAERAQNQFRLSHKFRAGASKGFLGRGVSIA